MQNPLPSCWMLTCPQRIHSFARTRASWRASDWPELPRVIVDDAPEQPGQEWGAHTRWPRVVRAYRLLMERALADPGAESDWLLLLEDDLEIHPRIAEALRTWPALQREDCPLATLFNRYLQPVPPGERRDPGRPLPARAIEVRPETFLGTQAILIRRAAIRRALDLWDTLPGMQSQRLARALSPLGPIYAHTPSLVQHTAPDSSWGWRASKALDFQPGRGFSSYGC